jgi:hypothetical protein
LPSRTTATRTLEDLEALETIQKSKDGVWSLFPGTEAKVQNKQAPLQVVEKQGG